MVKVKAGCSLFKRVSLLEVMKVVLLSSDPSFPANTAANKDCVVSREIKKDNKVRRRLSR